MFYNVFTIHSHYHGNKHIGIHNTFVIVVWDIGFHVGQTQLYVFPQPFLIPPINKSTFFTKDETRTHTLIDVVVIPNTCEFISSILHNSKICFQTKERSYHNQLSLINSSLYQLKYLNVDTKRLMCFYTILPMRFDLGTSKGSKALPFFVLTILLHEKISIPL